MMINIGEVSSEYSKKYIIVVEGLWVIRGLIIHPIWVMDEYAIMDLSFLWFIPRIPPVIALMQAIRVIIDGAQWVFRINVRIVRGPSFCHVLRIRQLIHEIEDITEGNQKWHGAIPIFRIIALIMMYDGTREFVWNHSEVEAIKIRLDPRA